MSLFHIFHRKPNIAAGNNIIDNILMHLADISHRLHEKLFINFEYDALRHYFKLLSLSFCC